MKKRIFICALIVALLFTNAALFSSAAGTELEQKYITVESYGTYYTQRVYTNKNGTIFVPITMLAQFGRLRYSEGASDYTFYRNSETSNSTGKRDFLAGARTITIAKAGTTATVSCYTSKNVAKTVSTVNFSKAHTVDKKLYLPLTEALPLLDAKVEITNDGVVHIYANSISAFYALYSGNMDLCAFDASEMVGGGFISASGLIVDSVLNFRFDRLDVMTNSGAIKDYSSLFKKLLTDNETYLSAFDKTETPLDKQISILNSEIGDLSDFAGGVKDLVKAYEYLFSSTKHSTYKEFSKEASTGLHSGVDLISAADKIISFADRYTKQVEDHRNMLNAVYGGSSKPAAVAANDVYTLYGQNTTAQITSAATSELRRYLSKIFSGAVSSTAGLTPYKIAFDAVQFLLPETAETWSDAAELYFIANVVNDSYNVATGYENNPKFDEASLERQRLALIMMLISSKYGYETFDDEDHDILNAIDPWLEKLYLAADSVECVSSGYYSATKSELQKTCRYIVSQNNSSPDESDDNSDNSEVSNDDSSQNIVASGKCGHNAFWNLDKNGTLTISGSGQLYDFVSHRYDSTQWYIDSPWYNYKNIITSVVITNGITTIGNESFAECTNIVSVTIPDSVTSIGDFAFDNCTNLSNITVGNNLTELGRCMFMRCPNIKGNECDNAIYVGNSDNPYVILLKAKDTNISSCVIQPGTKFIYDSAFQNCVNLVDVDIPNGVIAIDEGAFYNCTSLTSITIPDGVTSISKSTFGRCEKLTNVNIPNSVTKIEDTAFTFCTSLESITIPDSVTEIGSDVFMWCDTLTNITMPQSATAIGSSTFMGCVKLSSITIPDGITKITNGMFRGCNNLTSVTVPNSVTTIAAFAFEWCESLSSITIPGSVTDIGNAAFINCTSLTDVYYEGSESDWNKINIGTSNDKLTNATIHYNN